MTSIYNKQIPNKYNSSSPSSIIEK